MAMPGPTIYAALLEEGLANPLPDWNAAIEMQVRGLADGLARMGVDALREAYTAGVRDGYLQALQQSAAKQASPKITNA